MRIRREIEEILNLIEERTPDELEDQDLEFKEWDSSSLRKAIRTVIEWAICMANGGGGTVIFGVADGKKGRASAILGVPPEIDINRLKLAVYDATDPKLTPVFEELLVPEGTGRLIVMQVHPGIPPYTDTAGRGTIRVGRDCKPLTGTLRRKISITTGDNDVTATVVKEPLSKILSAAAMEKLREVAAQDRAPVDLLQLSDEELLNAIGVIRDGKPTQAALLLGGSPKSIQQHFPNFVWTHLRMSGDTEYSDRADGRDAFPISLTRILDRILADNPIQTVRQGLFHFEYRTYPEIALREALLNALCHADYRIASPIMIKQFADRLEITNPGGLIGGITPENILHHTPATRNPCLVDALVRLRLINRSNLGIQRMYTALLIEGKEPPRIEDLSEAFRLTFRASVLSPAFRTFVAEEGRRGIELTVDHLLVLQHMLRQAEIDSILAARICQRSQDDAREILSRMERDLGFLNRGGTGRGTYWTLRTEVHKRLGAPGEADRDRRIDWEAAKTRVLSILRQRMKQGESGMANAEIRRITGLSRSQVFRLMKELREENPEIKHPGLGKYAKYTVNDAPNADEH
jgi:ATP-dependent DNA helicase RecG